MKKRGTKVVAKNYFLAHSPSSTAFNGRYSPYNRSELGIGLMDGRISEGDVGTRGILTLSRIETGLLFVIGKLDC